MPRPNTLRPFQHPPATAPSHKRMRWRYGIPKILRITGDGSAKGARLDLFYEKVSSTSDEKW